MTNYKALIEAQNRNYVSQMHSLVALLEKEINNEVLLDGEKFDEVVRNIEASLTIIKNARLEAVNATCFKMGIKSFTINDKAHQVVKPKTYKNDDDDMYL